MRHAAMLWGNVKRELGKFLTKVFVGGSLTGTGTENDPIELDGDVENPGPLKYYGTDEHEVLTYHDFPEIGGDYVWNLKGKGVLPEISNIQIVQDGDDSEGYDEIEEDAFMVSAFNKNGETVPQPVPAFNWFWNNEMFKFTWNTITDAEGYYLYMIHEDFDNPSEIVFTKYKLLTNEYDADLDYSYIIIGIFPIEELPTENTAISDDENSVEVNNNDIVTFKGKDALISVIESEDKKTKTVTIVVDKSGIPDKSDIEKENWWNIGTGEGLHDVLNTKLTQTKTDVVEITKNKIFVSAYNSNGETKPVFSESIYRYYSGAITNKVTWDKVEGAEGYYVYFGKKPDLIDGIAIYNEWWKWDIDDGDTTEFDYDNSDGISYSTVYEIPTENTTRFSEFRIEHEDLLEIEGDGIDVELTADGRRKKLKLTSENEGGGGFDITDGTTIKTVDNEDTVHYKAGDGIQITVSEDSEDSTKKEVEIKSTVVGGSFDITDGTETVTIDPDDQITLTGDGVEIEVSEDEQDSTKKEIKLTADAEKITEIIQTETDKNKTSYLYDKYEDENLTHETGWTVEEWTEKVGHLKAVVSVFDIEEQTLVTLQNTMVYDFLSGEFKADNEIIKDGNDEITLELDVDNGKLIAVIEGMSENKKRIFLCFERCFDGIEMPEITPINFGLLYNYFAVEDERNIANEGWGVPSRNDIDALGAFLGTYNELNPDGYTYEYQNAGAKLKSTDSEFWRNDSGATNETNFNGKGSGVRVGTFMYDDFLDIKEVAYILLSDVLIDDLFYFTLERLWDGVYVSFEQKVYGKAIRLVKNSTNLQNGETGTYVGNDGKVYPTVCINGIEWLADNLAETRFRDGSIIPWYGANKNAFYTDNEWSNLETPACCAYDNDIENVAEDFEFPDY